MSIKTGYLTILSPDRTEIYGEFADAEWTSEMTDGGNNNIFTGSASDGTMETFRQLEKDGISHVAYEFDLHGHSYTGVAELMAPLMNELPYLPQIRIETGETPLTMP